MVNGSDVLTKPLTKIINESIVTGKFPNQWKEAIITPVLKNGDRELLKNYRPVSCLAAASKLLEKIVCAQVSEFFEVNNLKPNNQHGFRSNRSTMTAWCEMQEDWAKKYRKQKYDRHIALGSFSSF